MAHKDYVARGRSSSKKHIPPLSKPSLPWLRIIITLTLIVGFSYFLWSIKATAPDKLSDLNAERVLSKKDTLPDIPHEEWEFIKSLPEYTVEIEHKEQDQSTVRRLIQCGSFR